MEPATANVVMHKMRDALSRVDVNEPPRSKQQRLMQRKMMECVAKYLGLENHVQGLEQEILFTAPRRPSSRRVSTSYMHRKK